MRAPDYKNAAKKALDILNECGIIEPPIDLQKICADYGIKLHFVVFQPDYKNVSGFYDASEDAIYVNAEEFPARQTFTIAHELGHRFMHREWATTNNYQVLLREQLESPSKDPNEQEANTFAANLLVPEFMLSKYKSVPIDTLATLFAVSRPVIVNRLKSIEYKSSK